MLLSVHNACFVSTSTSRVVSLHDALVHAAACSDHNTTVMRIVSLPSIEIFNAGFVPL